MSKTGEELTELFFTRVKRWRYIDNQWVEFPEGKPNSLVLNWSENALPKLHLSLDLQAEWVWPELSKIISFEFCPRRNAKNPDEKWACYLYYKDVPGGNHYAEGSTVALAQLTASLKALGVEL